MKAACTVWNGGKGGESFKAIPIVIIDKLPNNAFQNCDFTKNEFHNYIDILKDNDQQISDIYAYSDRENGSLYEQYLDKFLEEVSKER